MICSWLSERLEISLHQYQLTCLSLIVKVTLNKFKFSTKLPLYDHFFSLNYQKIRNNFELQGVSDKVLDSKTYTTILNRLNVEEANQALR